jgi:pimeloyl-ACP methyl ester carboxylesterase
MTSSRTKIRSKASDLSVTGTVIESFAYAADGTRLYVRERPFVAEGGAAPQVDRRGSGLTAILCDGICCDGYIWKYLWEDLAAVTRLCHWNYRGHGRSATPVDPERIGTAAHADDLGCVRRHLGDGPVVLVGHSMGCQVVLEAYHQRPEKVAGLVLLCGSSGRLTQTFHGNDLLARVLPKLLRVAESRPGLMRGLWSRIPVQAALKVALATGEVDKNLLNPDDFIPYLEHATDMDLLLFLRMLQAAGDYSAEAFLGQVEVPALVIAGGSDLFTPQHLSEAMAKALPRGEFLMVPSATHVAPLEQRACIGARVVQFLSELGTP